MIHSEGLTIISEKRIAEYGNESVVNFSLRMPLGTRLTLLGMTFSDVTFPWEEVR